VRNLIDALVERWRAAGPGRWAFFAIVPAVALLVLTLGPCGDDTGAGPDDGDSLASRGRGGDVGDGPTLVIDGSPETTIEPGTTTSTASASTPTTVPSTTARGISPSRTTTTRAAVASPTTPGSSAESPPTPTTAVSPSAPQLPARPAGWPQSLEIGSADSPGGAAALRQKGGYGFRYQYLAGGVNTGAGWSTWNPNGAFVTNYIEESRAAGMMPVFTYYQMRQSSPGATTGEADGVAMNLANPSTMAAYFNDLKLFFQRAGAAGGTTVLHVEPDLWAYLQQRSKGDNAATVPASVASSGMADVGGLPYNAAGFARAIVSLRETVSKRTSGASRLRRNEGARPARLCRAHCVAGLRACAARAA
jgi:hypothetical protein